MTTPLKTFEVGKTYSVRSLCDWDCKYEFTIRSRTAKTVQVEVHGDVVKRGLRVWEGCETFAPFGTYSMSPVVRADRV